MAKFCEVLKNNFEKYENKRLFLHFEGYQMEEAVTYKEFEERAKKFAGYLQSIGSKGERALILLPICIDYLTAYVGCLLTQTISIPLYEVLEENQVADIVKIINNSDASYIITDSKSVPKLEECLGDLAEDLIFCTIDNFQEAPYVEKEIDDEDIAYLQYTSGSTKDAKGVKISYKNLYSSCKVMQAHLYLCDSDVFVSWLPFHFDMGLVGYIANTLFDGASCCFTSVNGFMKQPDSWLNAISIYKGTIIIAPNFCYEMCGKLPEETLSKMNLSSVRLTINGSELVRNSTLHKLIDSLEKYGLSFDSINPSYGLAENTLVVTSHEPHKGYEYITLNEEKLRENIIEYTESGLDIVSCGIVCGGVTVKVVGVENNDVLQDDNIGEIWVAGDSVSEGYWNMDDEEGFNNTLSNDDNKYFATGDLGFIHDRHLYIVGRKKDMVIIRGKNFYSQDIEELILNVTKDEVNTAVAFAVDSGEEEELVVIAEILPELFGKGEVIKDKIKKQISVNCKIVVSNTLLSNVGELPRTDSGKVQRQACKKLYLQGKFKV